MQVKGRTRLGTSLHSRRHLWDYVRRAEELRSAGLTADEKAVLAEILARDHRDMSRAVAPLKKAGDSAEKMLARLTEMKAVDIDRQRDLDREAAEESPWRPRHRHPSNVAHPPPSRATAGARAR